MTRFFQSYHQEINHEALNLQIYLWCLDEENQPNLFVIDDYYYSFYSEIPKEANTYDSRLLIVDQIKIRLGLKDLDWEIEQRKPFYNYTAKSAPYFLFKFKSKQTKHQAEKLLTKGLKVESIKSDNLVLKVYEAGIDPIRKMYTDLSSRAEEQEVLVATWFSVPDLESKRVTIDLIAKCPEFKISWRDIKADTNMRISRPWTMCYDIETYSNKDNEFPNAMDIKCQCYMISCTFEYLGDSSTRKYYCIYIGMPEQIDPKYNLISVETESELLKAFFNLIDQENPVLLTGYNLGDFDNNYIDKRVNITSTEIVNPALIKDCTKKFIKPAESKGYNSKSSSNLFTIPGRITIDLLDYMKRVYPSLTKHTLNFVSNLFIQEVKHDVSAPMMFKAYRRARQVQLQEIKSTRFEAELETEQESDDEFAEAEPGTFQHWIDNVLTLMENEWIGLEPILDTEAVRAEYRKVIEYCIQDTVLPLKLFAKLDIWTAQIELSNLMGVAIETLLTEGEQVRCFSQIYDLFHRENYVLIPKSFDNMNSEGGLVTSPKVGLHEGVITMDFASLYPSIIRAYNISLETEVVDDEVPDQDCEVREFYQMEIQPDPVNDKIPNKNTKRALELTKRIDYRYRYIKKEIYHGLLPRLMERLLVERNKLRKKIKQLKSELDQLDLTQEANQSRAKEIKLFCSVFNARQLAMKVSMNSVYGFLKVRKGAMLPYPNGARAITATGRQLIQSCNRYMSEDIDKLINTLSLDQIPEELKQYNLTTPCQIVYNDTDSCFITAAHIQKQHLALFGELLQTAFRNVFESSLILEYEQTLSIVLLVSKKRYTGYIMDNETGQIAIDRVTGLKETYTKGLITAKRDGTTFARNLFQEVTNRILDKDDYIDTLRIIFNNILKLISGQVDYKELSLMKTVGREYKTAFAEMAVFKVALEERGRPVNSGAKIDFVICKHPKDRIKLTSKRGLRDDTIKVGSRYWLIEEVEEKQAPPLDYLIYLDKISTAIDQIFSIAYANKIDTLVKIYYSKNRSKLHTCMLNPMTFYSKMCYDLEEAKLAVNKDIDDNDLMKFIYREVETHMSKTIEALTNSHKYPQIFNTDKSNLTLSMVEIEEDDQED